MWKPGRTGERKEDCHNGGCRTPSARSHVAQRFDEDCCEHLHVAAPLPNDSFRKVKAIVAPVPAAAPHGRDA
jgi:hypothetical protein